MATRLLQIADSLVASRKTYVNWPDGSIAVMDLVAHRAAGTSSVDTLTDANKRRQLIRFMLSIDAKTPVIAPDAATARGITNVASYAGNGIAPLSAAASFGGKLASKILSSPTAELPVTLDGSTLSFRDAAGILRLARLFYVSPGQVNFEAPAGMAAGVATATLQAGSGLAAMGTVNIAPVAPGLSAMNGNGVGVAAVTAIRVNADGTQSPVERFRCDAGSGCTGVPVDVASSPVFVSLYGTGIRGRSSLAGVQCTIGGVDTPVQFAGAQGAPGLDQVSVELPASLRDKGEVTVLLTVDSKVANVVTLTI